MTRDLGFARADIAADLVDDLKVRRLRRALRDDQAADTAVVVYLGVLLASWGAAQRVSAHDVAGAHVDLELVGAALVGAGLLDDELRVPVHAWRSWFTPAVDRRIEAKRGSLFGGFARKAGRSRDDANRLADQAQADLALAYVDQADLDPFDPRLNAYIGKAYGTEATSHPIPSIPSHPKNGNGMDGGSDDPPGRRFRDAVPPPPGHRLSARADIDA